MGDTKLVERQGLPADGAPTKLKFGESAGDKYRVRAISYGDGSSGHYGEKMLKRDFAAALPEGSRMRANHDGLCEMGGDIRRVIGRTISTPVAEADGMYVDILVAEEWSSYVREFGDIIGLSISMAGEYEDVPEGWHAEGSDLVKYSEDGEEVARRKRDVTRLLPQEEYPYSTLDFVEAPGANGRILQALESARGHLPEVNVREAATFAGDPFTAALARSHKTTEADAPGGHKEDIEMDEQTLRSILAEERATTVAAVEAKISESSQPAEAPVEKPSMGAMAEAVVAAGLTEFGRQAVYEAVDRGEALQPAIEREQAREAGIRKAVEDARPAVQYGFVTEAGEARETLDEDFSTADDVLERIGGR